MEHNDEVTESINGKKTQNTVQDVCYGALTLFQVSAFKYFIYIGL